MKTSMISGFQVFQLAVLLAVVPATAFAQDDGDRTDREFGHVVGVAQSTAFDAENGEFSGDFNLGVHGSEFFVQGGRYEDPMLLVIEEDLAVELYRVSDGGVWAGLAGIRGSGEMLMGMSGIDTRELECSGYGAFTGGGEFHADWDPTDTDGGSGHMGIEGGLICQVGEATYILTGVEIGGMGGTGDEADAAIGLVARLRYEDLVTASMALRAPITEENVTFTGDTHGEIRFNADARFSRRIRFYVGADLRISDADTSSAPEAEDSDGGTDVTFGLHAGYAL